MRIEARVLEDRQGPWLRGRSDATHTVRPRYRVRDAEQPDGRCVDRFDLGHLGDATEGRGVERHDVVDAPHLQELEGRR